MFYRTVAYLLNRQKMKIARNPSIKVINDVSEQILTWIQLSNVNREIKRKLSPRRLKMVCIAPESCSTGHEESGRCPTCIVLLIFYWRLNYFENGQEPLTGRGHVVITIDRKCYYVSYLRHIGMFMSRLKI